MMRWRRPGALKRCCLWDVAWSTPGLCCLQLEATGYPIRGPHSSGLCIVVYSVYLSSSTKTPRHVPQTAPLHSVNWTHTLRSLHITQKLCCNIDTANGLGPCTHQSSEDPHQLPPSYHILIPCIIIHGFLSVCFIFNWFYSRSYFLYFYIYIESVFIHM